MQSSGSTISGGQQNRIFSSNSPRLSTISGGFLNLVCGISPYSVIGGGACNTINVFGSVGIGSAVIAGGTSNTAHGEGSVIGGGFKNTVNSRGSIIGGGVSNTSLENTCFSFIGSGESNTLATTASTNDYSIILGGSCNIIDDSPYSLISSGFRNTLSGDTTGGIGFSNFIGSGNYNTILGPTGQYSAIVSGEFNKIVSLLSSITSGSYNGISDSLASFIGGGTGNTIENGCGALIAGGISNCITPNVNERLDCSSILSGNLNSICAKGSDVRWSSVASGSGNTVSAPLSFIGGGTGNCINTFTSNFIGGGIGNTVGGTASLVSGGRQNTVNQNFTSIVGGSGNFSCGCYNIVGGGRANSITILQSCYSSIVGGELNVQRGAWSFIGGGFCNTVCTNYSGIGGGQKNTVLAGSHGFIAGGSGNVAAGVALSRGTFIGSGYSNSALGPCGSVMGGESNRICAGAIYSFILGGCGNLVEGIDPSDPTKSTGYNFIGGGQGNTICAQETASNLIIGGSGGLISNMTRYSAIVSGLSNTISCGCNLLIATGFSNCIGTGRYSFIGSGVGNTMTSSGYSTISSGYFNTLSQASNSHLGAGNRNVICFTDPTALDSFTLHSSIHNGCNNVILTSDYSSIGNGTRNTILGKSHSSTISGGYDNRIGFIDFPNYFSARNSFIGGGTGNTIAAACICICNGFIGAGILNRVNANLGFIGSGVSNSTGCLGFIGSGTQNTSAYGFVGTGYSNYAILGFVGGGTGNTINTIGEGHSFIGAGVCNRMSSSYGFIGSGRCNSVSDATDSSILGGVCNLIAIGATAAAIAGGQSNTSNACYSFIGGGLQSSIDLYGERAYSAGGFSNDAGSAQQIDLIARNEISSTSANELFLDGNSRRMVIPAGHAWFVTVNVAGVLANAGGFIHIIWKVAIQNNAGTVSILGANSQVGTGTSTGGTPSSIVTVVADTTNDAMKIEINNYTASRTRFVAHVQGIQMKWPVV